MDSVSDPIKVDVRAKVIWGESPEKVLQFTQAKGIPDELALELIEEFLKERAATIRADGTKKALLGALLLATPIVYYFGAIAMGFLSYKMFSVTLVAGIFGIAKLTNGISMIVSPKSVSGDLAFK